MENGNRWEEIGKVRVKGKFSGNYFNLIIMVKFIDGKPFFRTAGGDAVGLLASPRFDSGLTFTAETSDRLLAIPQNIIKPYT